MKGIHQNMEKNEITSTVYIDNIRCKITGLPPQIANLLSKELAVKVPNYWFSVKFKNGQWDGTQKFFLRPANTFPTGLLPQVSEFLQENFGIIPQVVDKREGVEQYSLNEIPENYEISDTKTARDYQVDTVNKLIRNEVLGVPFPRGVVNIATNGGKAQPLYAKVLTPQGFKTMGEIHPGDKVIGEDGLSHVVLKEFLHESKHIFRVTLNDGTTTECCDEHLWAVQNDTDRERGAYRVLSLKEINGKLFYGRKDPRPTWSIPVVRPVEFEHKPVLIDPWLVGFLIGDGSLSSGQVRFSTSESDILDKATKLVGQYGDTVVHYKNSNYCDFAIQGNHLRQLLKKIGLLGCRSYEKFVPADYLINDYKTRLELLRGILDADGYVNKGKSGYVEYSTTSKQLRTDVKWLVESMGGSVVTSERPGKYTKNNETIETGRLQYGAGLRFFNTDVVPVSSQKHLKKWSPRKKRCCKYITKVEYVGDMPAKCIYIDNPSHLYVTDDFIVTHNTSIATALIKELYPKLVANKHVVLFVTHSKEIARQAKKTIEDDLGIQAGFIGDGKWQVEPVTIAIVTTLYRRMRTDEFKKLAVDTIGFVGDECLSANSLVLLPNNRVMTIKEICEREDVNEVMSYNIEKNIFEPKRILRKIVTPGTEQFWKIWFTDPVDGQLKGLTATKNHKIWTANRGYVRVDELTTEDIIKINTSKPELWNKKNGNWYCSICKRGFSSKSGYGGHMSTHSKNYEDGIKRGVEARKKKYASGEIKISEEQKRKSSEWMKQYNSKSEVKEFSANRCKTELATKETRKKQGESLRKTIQSNENFRNKLLTQFKNAPLYQKGKITMLEKWVINLNISNIEFTGDGKLWLAFDKEYHSKYGKRYKNPDFVVHNGNDKKVIEVGDIEYWHTEEEIKDVINQYKKLGYECLYLTSEDILQRPDWCKGKIQKFIFNHNVKIEKISKSIGLIPAFKYNLEVEDNHNYFADNILVSNCHHSSSTSWYEVFSNLPNAIIRVGLTGTVDKTNPVNEMRLYSCTSKIINKISNDYLIEKGFSAKPICILFTVTTPELEEETYSDAYSLGIVESKERLGYITQICEKETGSGNVVLILVEHIEHGQIIEEELQKLNKRVFFTNGSLTSETRQELLDNLKSGKIDVLISTAILDEGVDVSNINAVIYARGMKSTRKLLQGLGRGLRKKPDGSKLRFYDFIDDMNSSLLHHSLSRYQVLKAEKFVIKSLNIESYKKMTWRELESE